MDATALYGHLDAAQRERLAGLAAAFERDKRVVGAHGLQITADMRAAIIAQACLPILELGLDAYGVFTDVIVYPGRFRVNREVVDEAGVVTHSEADLAGEAMEGGPVVLSWADADIATAWERDAHHAPADWASSTNLVIHEFAHKLAATLGLLADPGPGEGPAQAWWDLLNDAYEEYVEEVEQADRALPADLDPESDEAAAWYAHLTLDPYAATDLEEFFAVTLEAFFAGPRRLQGAWPDFYAALCGILRQDPARRMH